MPNKIESFENPKKLRRRFSNSVSIVAISMLSTLAFAFVGLLWIDGIVAETLALRSARVLVHAVNVARKNYSADVLSELRGHPDITIGPDHKSSLNHVPNPATFAIEFAESVSSMESDVAVRMFSQYPFPNRAKDGGARDDFERRLLAAFERDPDTPYYEVTSSDHGPQLRYGEPIKMEETCVACHNTHPDSPKRNWRVGEVRGAVAVTRTLEAGERVTSLRSSAILGLFALATISFVSIGAATRMLNRYAREVSNEIAKHSRQLEDVARTDSLTGLSNRRAFDERVELEISRAIRSRTSLALILCDVDLFKRINDEFGHDAGDHCLRRIGAQLSSHVRRQQDLLARWGGEEFAILLPDTGEKGAACLAERICRSIPETVTLDDGSPVSASFGVAALIPTRRDEWQLLLASSDRALYAAKHAGRCCVKRGSETTAR